MKIKTMRNLLLVCFLLPGFLSGNKNRATTGNNVAVYLLFIMSTRGGKMPGGYRCRFFTKFDIYKKR
jgi:hypothetical protein